MVAILVRELRSYFHSITGFIFMGFFLLLSGIFFTLSNLMGNGNSDFRITLANISFIFLITIPILTMRLLSEESRQKTDQVLLTRPVSLLSIVLGKYLAALVLFVLTLLVTVLYPILLDVVGLIVVSEVFGSYLGVFFLGCSFIAVGLFISSLTDNQVIAAVATFSVLLVTWIIDWLQKGLPSDRASGIAFAALAVIAIALYLYLNIRNILISVAAVVAGGVIVAAVYAASPSSYDGLIVRILKWISLLGRNQEFQRGILSMGAIVYYLCFSVAFLFLTIRVIEKRRWK
jgi:ABC-2 type transport system permease protein